MNKLIIKSAAPELWDESLDVDFEIKEVSEDGTFSGYASTFNNIDSDRDVIEQGAFTKTLNSKKIKDIKLLWYHDARKPIGVWEEIIQDKKGLLVKGRLILEVEQAREAYALMKAGAIDTMSIGFSIDQDGYTIDEKKRVRRINSVDLWEISIVTFPANKRAKIQRVKSAVPFQDLPLADRGRTWDSSKAEERIRQWAGGSTSLDDMDWSKYKSAFLWFDGDEPNSVASYKLPIADIVNGDLTTIPRAIFSAAGAMLGARGGVDIPDAAKNRIISHLERYYSKMDMESPFKMIDLEESVKSFNVAFLSAQLDAKGYEQALREVGFSNSEAKAITAKIGPQREVEAESLADALKSANNLLLTLQGNN